MIYAAGVDVGSTQTKVVILNEHQQICGRALVPTGANLVAAAENGFRKALENAGLPRECVRFTVGTGYGRFRVTFGDTQITEIACHARGAKFLFPETQTVIDMGGQDTKAIKVGPTGEVLDFAMNDKCAAGTGRFLAAAADVMDLSLDDIGPISLTATRPVKITSVCTVFVESDIMSYLAQGRSMEDILAGVHRSIAARTLALVRRVGVDPEITFTGGVARNKGMVHALQEAIGFPLNVSEESHFNGALGAAIFAIERATREALAQKPTVTLGSWLETEETG
ncbi:MAG: acyl-CoA dehydratase activase [bacterium JZ-2024 1]